MRAAFRLQIRGTVLWILDIHLPDFPYRAVTVFSAAFQRTSGLQIRRKPVQTPHLCSVSGQIRFVLFGFQSPLLTESQLFSFPAVNKMFQFSALLFTPYDANIWDVPLGDTGFDICVRFARSYGSLPPPSSAIKPIHPPNSMGASYLCSGPLTVS